MSPLTLPSLPTILPLLTTLLTLPTPPVHAIDKTSNPDLSAKLKLATTTLDRHSLLTSNSDWTFTFPDQPNYTFQPGGVVNANAATFPALTGLGMTLAMLNLGPCAMLPPHAHPRATNLVVAVTGNTTSYMVNENGAKTVQVDLTPGVMTMFPRGSLHSMQNNGCENAQLVSALDSEDTGTINYFNSLAQLPEAIVRAGYGNNGNVDHGALMKEIPDVGTGSVLGSAECMARCGMKSE